MRSNISSKRSIAILSHQLKPGDVVETFSGVRPLFDNNVANPSAVTRDYVFDIDAPAGAAPMLSVFGGKITTYRKLAEHALERLKPYFPKMGAAWSAGAALPGGDIPDADFEAWFAKFRGGADWLPSDVALGYARRYGSQVAELLGDARSLPDLGRHFGAGLYEREARFLIDEEWATTAEDILTRRTKHGLHMTRPERETFAAWVAEGAREPARANRGPS